jgi:3-oxoacyl-[acyl-carrier protein] reductase
MDYGLKNKTAIVTAGSKGIGLATAHLLAQEGAKVAICARDAQTLAQAEKALKAHGGLVFAAPCDVSDKQALKDFASAARDALGPIQILVNNAGGPRPGGFKDVADEDWQKAFELTLMSAVTMTACVIDDMRAAGWGRVINISSYSIKQPIPQILLSNVMRLGVQGWAKSLASDVAADGVTVNTVCPGWTLTDRVKSMLSDDTAESAIKGEIPMQRLGTPEEIAAAVLFFASAQAAYITGAALQVDGGIVRSSL